jgi:hypothetical protein
VRAGENLKGANGLTLVVEGDKEFLWLTDQYGGKPGKHMLARKRVASIEPPGTIPYALTWAAILCTIAKSRWPRDTAECDPVLLVNGKSDWTTYGVAEGVDAFACPHGHRLRTDENFYVTERHPLA